jgi:hypothetical protein
MDVVATALAPQQIASSAIMSRPKCAHPRRALANRKHFKMDAKSILKQAAVLSERLRKVDSRVVQGERDHSQVFLDPRPGKTHRFGLLFESLLTASV